MAKRLKRSSLLFGQTQKPATTPSLSRYYQGVAAGRTGAVQEIGKGVEEKTRGLGAELGLTETVDEKTGKVTTGMGDKFNVTVDTGSGTISKGAKSAVAAPTATAPGAADADEIQGAAGGDVILAGGGEKDSKKQDDDSFKLAKTPTIVSPTKVTGGFTDAPLASTLATDINTFTTALETLGKNIEDWKASGLEAKEYLDKALADTRKNATDIITEVNQRLGEKNLGQRRAPSEVEKQAENYQNIIASEPGTSNIKALANLSRFYDMSRYGAVESGIRQGEIALSRQEMLDEKEAMDTAEGARTAAIKNYGEQSKLLTGELEEGLTEQEAQERKKLEDYFAAGEKTLTEEETRLKGEKEASEKQLAEEEERIAKEKEKRFKTIESKIFGGDDPESGELRKGLQNRIQSLKSEADGFERKLSEWRDKGMFTAWKGISKDKGLLENMINIKRDAAKELEGIINKMKVAREQQDSYTLETLYDQWTVRIREINNELNKKVSEMSDTGKGNMNWVFL